MATLTEHIIRLTDHRDRELLELTLSKALIDLLRIDRVVVARVVLADGVKRWLDIAALDARGGGKVQDPLRIDFLTLSPIQEDRYRLNCLQSNTVVEHAWAGEDGPRITYLSLFGGSAAEDEGVVEIHAGSALSAGALQLVHDLLHAFRNMYRLLAYSDRDALTGLLNRKALDDTFYSAVLEELDHGLENQDATLQAPVLPVAERRHRVPPNYWLGSVRVDHFGALNDRSGHWAGEEVLLLVARILNNTFRTYDRLYRLGSDHFAVLMHCPQEALVLAAFERFRANVEKFNFPQVGRVTICAGFTRISPEDSPQSSLERTARAIAHAQGQGRNQVHSHDDLERQGQWGAAAPELPTLNA